MKSSTWFNNGKGAKSRKIVKETISKGKWISEVIYLLGNETKHPTLKLRIEGDWRDAEGSNLMELFCGFHWVIAGIEGDAKK